VDTTVNIPGTLALDSTFVTATELAASIRERRVSSVDVLNAYLDQIARNNARVNAVVTLDEERARQRARDADRALARGEIWGPLHGVPFTVKDWTATAGVRTTLGQTDLAEYVPEADSEPVARWRAAGGILLGKTNTPGLGGGYQCENPVFGRTNNPWNAGHTPGGSSGGSAAAVAAGLTPLDLGSDGGGSLRVPAHYCGVYTIKATELRVTSGGPQLPTKPLVPSSFRHMSTPGPIARSVEDLILGLSLICGPGPRTFAVPPVSVDMAPALSLRELKLAWTDDFGVPVTADTSRALVSLADELSRLGCRIERCDPEGFDGSLASEAWGALWLPEVGTPLPPPSIEGAREGAWAPDLESEDHGLRGMARMLEGTVSILMEYMLIRDQLISAMEELLTQWDALLCPVTVGPAIAHCAQGTPIAVDDHTVPYWVAGIHYTAPFNLTGNPAVVIPMAHSAGGLPIGLQVVGKRWSDMRVLRIAEAISETIGPFQQPPLT
jgi:amidase